MYSWLSWLPWPQRLMQLLGPCITTVYVQLSKVWIKSSRVCVLMHSSSMYSMYSMARHDIQFVSARSHVDTGFSCLSIALTYLSCREEVALHNESQVAVSTSSASLPCCAVTLHVSRSIQSCTKLAHNKLTFANRTMHTKTHAFQLLSPLPFSFYINDSCCEGKCMNPLTIY